MKTEQTPWQTISETNLPPVNEEVLLRWPMVLVDDDDGLTDEVDSLSTVLGCYCGDGQWDDFGAMENTNAAYRLSDDETAAAPIEFMLIPKPIEHDLPKVIKGAGDLP